MYHKSKLTATPYVVWMILFTALPLGMVIYFAFTDSMGQFTLDNLSGLGNYISVFALSLSLAAIATGICLILAYPMGFILSRLRPGQQKIWVMLVMLPTWMNFLLRTYAWMSLLETNGLINQFMGLFGLGPFQMINTQGAIVLGMVYNYLPFMILPLYNAMLKISDQTLEAAADLGAGPWRQLMGVIFPLSKPGIRTGMIMDFVPSISTFIISKMLGGGDSWLIGDLIEAQLLGNSYNPQVGSAMSLVLMVVVLLILALTGGINEESMEEVI